jgi:hypothetical protein
VTDDVVVVVVVVVAVVACDSPSLPPNGLLVDSIVLKRCSSAFSSSSSTSRESTSLRSANGVRRLDGDRCGGVSGSGFARLSWRLRLRPFLPNGIDANCGTVALAADGGCHVPGKLADGMLLMLLLLLLLQGDCSRNWSRDDAPVRSSRLWPSFLSPR